MTGEQAFNEYKQALENAIGFPTPSWHYNSLPLAAQAAWNYIANRIDGVEGNESTVATLDNSFDKLSDQLLNKCSDGQRQMMYELLYASGCRINR